MSCSLDIVNPITQTDWNEVLLASPGSSFFHTSNWAAVLQESYEYRPLYFAKRAAGRLESLVALMEVSSWLTGRRAVSLPFTDYCDPIVTDRAGAQELRAAINRHAKAARWKYVELRGGDTETPFATYYRHVVDVSEPEDALFSRLRDSTKRNIKKAMRKGLTLTMSQSAAALAEFYRLHCMTRQGHGVPPQPYRFFEKIHEHVISQGLGHVVSAEYEGRIVAASVYFHFGQNALYKYGASDKAYQWLRPNNLVMWEAIKWYSQNGYRSLCLGRTELSHTGLRQFKTGWGADERLIRYLKYDVGADRYVEDTPQQGTPAYHRVMSRMPVPLLRLAGSILYRHVG